MDFFSRKMTVWQSLDRILPSVLCWRVIECQFLPTMACFSWKGKSFQEPRENPSNNPSENPSEKPSRNPKENPSVKQSENPSENLSENPNNCKCHNQESHNHNCKSHNLFNASSSTASPKTEKFTTRTANPTTCSMQVQQLQLKIPQLQIPACYTTIILHVPQLSFFFYQPKIWEVGVGQRRRGFTLSIQSKNWLKTHF